MTCHVAHGFHVISLALFKLLFECFKLGFKYADVTVYMVYFFFNALNTLLSLTDFGIKQHEILQSFLYIGLIGTQCLFLLSYLFLYL